MRLSIVIHAIFSPEAGVTQIPFVLRGEAPSPKDVENVGTQNYSRPAATVILGGAYDDAMVSQMREACKESSRVPWLRLNQSTPTPPLGPEYGKALVERIKVGLKELEAKGNMKEDGVYYY